MGFNLAFKVLSKQRKQQSTFAVLLAPRGQHAADNLNSIIQSLKEPFRVAPHSAQAVPAIPYRCFALNSEITLSRTRTTFPVFNLHKQDCCNDFISPSWYCKS